MTGDDVTETLRGSNEAVDDTGAPIAGLGDRLISANAYLGAGGIIEALERGADVVVIGRVADPAMFLAPLIHEFGWSMEDWTRVGQGTVVGHLLECAGQITGGYLADLGFKDVPDLARLGFPVAEVAEDGSAIITKVAGSGGRVTAATCKEQLLYEVHDPAQYLQPDVVADFSQVRVEEVGPDQVRIEAGSGRPRTGTLKVPVVSRLIRRRGPDLLRRSRRGGAWPSRAGDRRRAIATDRPAGERTPLRADRRRFDPRPALSAGAPEPREIRARVAGRADSLEVARRIADEVDALYLNDPASGGGVLKVAREIVGIRSTLVPESLAAPGELTMTRLRALAHSRTGDKGDISNIAVICYDPADFQRIAWHARVRQDPLAGLVRGEVARYDLPGLGASTSSCRAPLAAGSPDRSRSTPMASA